MRATLGVLARHLETGMPTGLTGLRTHPTPRSTLLYLYGSTLARLERLPATSLYRQSVEAVTRHRLGLVEATRPADYDLWLAGARKMLANDAEAAGAEEVCRVMSGRADVSATRGVRLGRRFFFVEARRPRGDVRDEEWDGEDVEGGFQIGGIPTRKEVKEYEEFMRREGIPLEEEEAAVAQAEESLVEGSACELVFGETATLEARMKGRVVLEEEPQLDPDQIKELENKIGAGLIEEVIEVAEGELKMIGVMEKAKVWEDLEEKPVEGQWTYFERS